MSASNTPTRSGASSAGRQSSRRISVHAARAASASERARLQASLDQLHRENDALMTEIAELRQQAPSPAVHPSIQGTELVTEDEIERLVANLDDSLLTALISRHDHGMFQQLFESAPPDQNHTLGINSMSSTTAKAFAAVPPPAVSAGIEGVGSALEIDFRLASGQADGDGRVFKRRRTSDKATDEAWMEEWLIARRKRGLYLLSTLQTFTGLNIEEIQRPSGERETLDYPSPVSIRGRMDKIGSVGVSFSVLGHGAEAQPRVQGVQIDLPLPVRAAIEPDGHLDRITAAANLPAIFMTLTSLAHGATTRRKVFAAIESRIRTSSPDTLMANAASLRLSVPSIDENDEEDLRRWYDPRAAETLVLRNSRGAELRFRYRLTFDPFGRGLQTVALDPWLPPAMRTAQAEEILAPMPNAFSKLTKEKPGIEGMPDTAVLADIVLNFASHFFGAN